MKTILTCLLLAFALGTMQFAPAHAVSISGADAVKSTLVTLERPEQLVAQDAGKWPIKPSQAALIAQDAYPGSIVLGVKLLPSGQYAVTLKAGGSVQKVLVNATSGSLG